MANQKFCGAVASQAYRWGYTCEFCKQPVEKKNYISTQVGSMHKSTTWVTTTAAGAKAMEEQARMQLAGPVAQMQAKLDAGQFDAPKGEDGKCPHCKKLQHWSPALRNYAASQSWSDEQRKKENRGTGCGMAICGFWGGVILAIPVISAIINPLLDRLSNPNRTAYVISTLIGCIVLGEALSFLIGKRLVNRGNAKNAALLKELEGLEKNEPRFIAWEELNSGLRGISIR